MKRIALVCCFGRHIKLRLIPPVLFVCGLLFFLSSRDAGSQTIRSTATVLASLTGVSALPDPARVMTERACIDCHKSEIRAWQQTKHHANRDMLRTEPKAKEFAEELGIPLASLTEDSLCVRCHGLQQADNTGRARAVSGVSCESCHGASGGENGWLNPHGSYGGTDITREMETAEHRQQRIEQCEAAGMIRPARLYRLAKNCFECHTVSNEKLVNSTGHPAGSEFELVAWSQGEVRHNFRLDPTTNAEAPSLWTASTGRTVAERRRLMFLIGLLVDLEVSLRNLATAEEADNYSRAMASRARSARGFLEETADFADVPEIGEVLEVYDDIRRNLRPGNADELNQAAEQIAAIAQKFEASYDGSELVDLDEIIPTKFQGEVFQP